MYYTTAIHFIAIVQVRNYELFLCFWYKWSFTKLQYKLQMVNLVDRWEFQEMLVLTFIIILHLLSHTILICYGTCHERCVMRKCHYCHQNVIITIQGQKLIASHYWQLSCCPAFAALSPCLIIFLWWSPRWSNYGFNVITFQSSLLSKKYSNKFW